MKPTPLDILLIDGESVFAYPVALCLAQQPDVRLHILADSFNTPLRFSRHHCSYHVRRSRDDDESVAAMSDILRRTGAAIVLPTGEDSLRLVSAHRDAVLTALPPTPEADTLDLVADKWRLACFLRERALPHPVSHLAESPMGRPPIWPDCASPSSSSLGTAPTGVAFSDLTRRRHSIGYSGNCDGWPPDLSYRSFLRGQILVATFSATVDTFSPPLSSSHFFRPCTPTGQVTVSDFSNIPLSLRLSAD